MVEPGRDDEHRCALSDLPTRMCAHCCGITPEDGDAHPVGPPIRDYAHQTQGLGRLRMDYRSGRWHSDFPIKPILCDHGRPEGRLLCVECELRLRRMLADVPRLIGDLAVQHSKQNRFLQRGFPQKAARDPDDDTQPSPEESPIAWNERAAEAARELALALDGEPTMRSAELLGNWLVTMRLPQLPEFASRLSRAFLKAMRAIDSAPYLTHYGKCPTCGEDIRQERVAEGEEVTCRCGYSADVDEHRTAQLEFGADTMMTLTQVVKVLCDAGEPVSRQEIENLIYRDGLPREERPVWRSGKVEKVWHYRLGDVRDFRAARQRRRAS